MRAPAQKEKVYIAIDLKSFYASVECVERKLDPLNTNLVVADLSRTEKTICLAVSPSLKAWGISGRARLFEVIARVKEVNRMRIAAAPGGVFRAKSAYDDELKRDPSLELDYLVAVPQMAKYMQISSQIYDVYLKYVAPEDIHVYSIDEVFMDVTGYLRVYGKSPEELARTIVQDVLQTTGITATAGIAPNLFLCKVAMDIVAKHIPADENGVRIASLDLETYRKTLWTHRPLTDFWRVGRGYAKKLEENGLYTMGDIARCSLGKANEFYNEELLYRLFGVNAELLIDHAWGYEPCDIAHIKAYRPENNSVGAGQVLSCGYDFKKARLVVREMADQLAFSLLEKHLVTDQLVLDVGYDRHILTDPAKKAAFKGQVVTDRFGLTTPKPAHGSINLKRMTSSERLVMEAAMELYDTIVDPTLPVHRLNIAANHVITEEAAAERQESSFEQLDLFTDYAAREKAAEEEEALLAKERRMSEAALALRRKFGKNAVLKGMSLQEGATARERNAQIGGHKA